MFDYFFKTVKLVPTYLILSTDFNLLPYRCIQLAAVHVDASLPFKLASMTKPICLNFYAYEKI